MPDRICCPCPWPNVCPPQELCVHHHDDRTRGNQHGTNCGRRENTERSQYPRSQRHGDHVVACRPHEALLYFPVTPLAETHQCPHVTRAVALRTPDSPGIHCRRAGRGGRGRRVCARVLRGRWPSRSVRLAEPLATLLELVVCGFRTDYHFAGRATRLDVANRFRDVG